MSASPWTNNRREVRTHEPLGRDPNALTTAPRIHKNCYHCHYYQCQHCPPRYSHTLYNHTCLCIVLHVNVKSIRLFYTYFSYERHAILSGAGFRNIHLISRSLLISFFHTDSPYQARMPLRVSRPTFSSLVQTGNMNDTRINWMKPL